jgi:phosphoglycerate dehydrogenase-like enzyme
MKDAFRIGLTRDFLKPDGTVGMGDISLSVLDGQPGIVWEFLAEDVRELRSDQIRGYDALGVLGPSVTAETLTGAERLAIVARFGVGYDSVDVPACTAHGVALTITPDGVRRPVASSVMAFLLALSHRMFDQDRATRAGEGWRRKLDLMGWGLVGKTLGLVGLGNIGGEVARLARPFDLRIIASDPYVSSERAAALGVELVDLETLLSTADYVAVVCALTPETRGLISAHRLALMKPTAFLINTARGPIVDQRALYEALRDRRIRGAGLDVFEQEPIDPNDPLLQLDNVILTPHGICWTDECMAAMGRSVMTGILTVAAGKVPPFVVNQEVLQSPLFQEKLRRYAARLES